MLWSGPQTKDGYGIAEVGHLVGDGKRHRTLAHRKVWWEANGDPGNLVIHHAIHCSRLCVNLEHLVAVDKNSHDEYHKVKQVCKRRHDRTNPDNIWVDSKGNRHCRPCWRERRQET